MECFEDHHLNARGFIRTVRHPILGEHNEYVICDVLGYNRSQLEEWQRRLIVD
jgi:hypothetical protein